jgi:hypothetical protein
MRASASSLRQFVTKGGVVVTLAQESDVWDIEPWLPEKAFVLRGRGRSDRLGAIDTGHPVFNRPNSISLDRLNAEWKGDNSWPARHLSWWSFRRAERAHVLGARNGDGEDPWALELGWGKGRVLLFACAPDKPPGAPKHPALNICDALLQNILTYAESAASGKPYPLPEGVEVEDDAIAWRRFTRALSREEKRDFDMRVNETVDQGIAWLKKKQDKNGSWGTFGYHNGPYEVGLSAIALLALLNSGVSKYDKTIEKGFEFIFGNPPKRTYEIALTLMAMEVRAAPMYERFELARLPEEQREKHEFKRDLEPEERAFMQNLTEVLIASHARGGCWRYDPEVGGGDISNGQFAVLGLRAASRCGIKIPRQLWAEVLEYYIQYQAKTGPDVRYFDFKSYAKDGSPKFYATRGESRAWGYGFGLPSERARGSHANIGVCALILVYEALMMQRAPEAAEHRGRVRTGIRDGMAWIASNWCIDANPNEAKHHYYYYIYSLERVGSLVNKPFIGDHDWYREGAFYLIHKQEPDGHWATQANEWGNPISNTSFALLFLKRSTPPPVITVGK